MGVPEQCGVSAMTTTAASPTVKALPPATAEPRRRHLSRLVLTGVALLIGVPATAVGVGLGIPHALAGAWSTAVPGIAALIAGLVLLVGVAVATWRRARWWGRLGVVVVALLVVQFLLFPLSQAVFATNRAPMPLPARTPADVGLQYADVVLTTADGVDLAAWYVPSRNGAAAVLRHGSGSTRVNVLDHAAALAAQGFGVLLVDARGHGASGGDEMDFGWFGDADIAPAVDFLAAAPDVTGDRIAVVGMSMGGEEAIGAMASDPRIRAVVAEGATGRSGADWLPLRPAGLGRFFSTIFYWVQDGTADLLTRASRPIDLRTAVVTAAPRPVLVIAGGTVAQERAAGRRLQAAAPATVTLWEVEGAGHIAGLRTAPTQWQSRVGAFLDDALRVAGP